MDLLDTTKMRPVYLYHYKSQIPLTLSLIHHYLSETKKTYEHKPLHSGLFYDLRVDKALRMYFEKFSRLCGPAPKHVFIKLYISLFKTSRVQ